MSKINVKVANEDTIIVAQKYANKIVETMKTEDTNDWINYQFRSSKPIFYEKKYKFDDFTLECNPECKDKTIDFNNSITLYEHLKNLPRFILASQNFWFWLNIDKFYKEAKSFMPMKDKNTFKRHWLYEGGVRRGIFFGVLSRMYYRVELTVDESLDDKYELTRWIIGNPERFRNLSWRSFSSENHLVRGIIKGEKRYAEEEGEKTSYYTEIAKYISLLGSVRLLDAITEEEIEDIVYNKLKDLNKDGAI